MSIMNDWAGDFNYREAPKSDDKVDLHLATIEVSMGYLAKFLQILLHVGSAMEQEVTQEVKDNITSLISTSIMEYCIEVENAKKGNDG